jgi:hypothetical protein
VSIFDTVYLHDTIYVTTEGIDGVDGVSAKIYQRGGQAPARHGASS